MRCSIKCITIYYYYYYRGMEERQVKAHSLVWFVAAVSPDRLRDINTGGQPFNS